MRKEGLWVVSHLMNEVERLTRERDALVGAVKAARVLLDALAERQREESDAANAHVSHGQKVGQAISRLKRALKEAKI